MVHTYINVYYHRNTVYPLLTLTNVPMVGTMMSGWINAYKEGTSMADSNMLL